MHPDICIYHANCADGFGAAWAVWKRFGDVVCYVPAGYGSAPPDVCGAHVVIVDFSYKRDVLHAMAAEANTLVILDHHKTAAEDLAGLPALPTGPYNPVGMRQWANECNAPAAVHALFDMNRSGARIAWEYFHQPTIAGIPWAIRYIEDRDLWRFSFKRTRAVQAALMSYDLTFAQWDELIAQCEADEGAQLAAEGSAIDRRLQKDLEALLAVSRRTMRIGGHEVPVANVPFHMSSDAGQAMNGAAPFAATYLDTADGRVFSLRSRGDFDVSAIAKGYGGGGHKNAAGFKMPRGWEGEP